MKKSVLFAVISALFLLYAPVACSAVVDSSYNGFTVQLQFTIRGQADSVFSHLVGDIGRWWSSDHTFSGDAGNLYIQPKAGGCFCERLGNRGEVRHMEVIFLQPGKMLRMEGGLGPLQALAVEGVMTFTLTQKGETTTLDVIYTVGGYTRGGLQKLASVVDMVLGQQMTRFKAFVER